MHSESTLTVQLLSRTCARIASQCFFRRLGEPVCYHTLLAARPVFYAATTWNGATESGPHTIFQDTFEQETCRRNGYLSFVVKPLVTSSPFRVVFLNPSLPASRIPRRVHFKQKFPACTPLDTPPRTLTNPHHRCCDAARPDKDYGPILQPGEHNPLRYLPLFERSAATYPVSYPLPSHRLPDHASEGVHATIAGVSHQMALSSDSTPTRLVPCFPES